MSNNMNFLKLDLGELFSNNRIKPKKELSESEKNEKRVYAKLYRLCKKHNLSYKCEGPYWDFCLDDKPIGTISMAHGVECYEHAYLYTKAFIDSNFIKCFNPSDSIAFNRSPFGWHNFSELEDYNNGKLSFPKMMHLKSVYAREDEAAFSAKWNK